METESFTERAEAQEFLRQRSRTVDRSEHIFKFLSSAGYQTKKLAQLTTTFDYIMKLLNWDVSIQIDEKSNRPIITEGYGMSLTRIVKANQATVDGKYHNDYIKVALAEERIEQKSRIGIAGSNTGGSPITGQ